MSLLILNGLVLDPNAKAIINNGGITGITEKKAVSYLAKALKANGLWNLFHAIYPFVGGTATSHSYNLKNTSLYRITWVNGPTHASTGVDFNGTTQYGDTGLIPDSVLTANDTAFHYYSRSSEAISGNEIASSNGATQTVSIGVRIAGDTTIADLYSSTGGRLTTSNTDGSGMFTFTRTANSHIHYRNGSSLGSNATSGGTLPTVSLYIGARNTSGSAGTYSTHEGAFAAISKALTDAQASTLFTIVDTYQKKLSRNV